MAFLEDSARAWLVVHAVLGAATVALSTHLVFWLRGYPRGDFARHGAVRWFAAASLLVYALQFAAGNLLYPVYKVRVRVEYLDAPAAVEADVELRAGAKLTRPAPSLAPVARVFDIKEHWAALGLALAIAAFAVAWGWNPARDGRGGTSLLVGLAVGAALCAWLAALVGIVVTSFRSVGRLA